MIVMLFVMWFHINTILKFGKSRVSFGIFEYIYARFPSENFLLSPTALRKFNNIFKKREKIELKKLSRFTENMYLSY